jgi:hypothetical protein
MRKAIVMTSVAVCALVASFAANARLVARAAQEPIKGEWVGRVREADRGNKLWLQLYRSREQGKDSNKDGREHFSQMSFDIEPQELSGFNASSTSQFSLRREAGTVLFDGVFKDGKGLGDYSFTPNAAFVTAMNGLGYENLSTEKLFSMTIFNVTTSFINEMKSIGYANIPQDKLISMRIFKVDAAFVREWQALGYEKPSLDKLISLRVHKVDAQFMKEVEALGFRNVSLDKLISMRIHRVTGAFIKEMKDLGYTNLSVDDLIKMRIHGIDSNFVRRMKGAQ